ncbi:MAG: hypothetical protein AAGJ82_02295, partial [Bacteroidota bacterium]
LAKYPVEVLMNWLRQRYEGADSVLSKARLGELLQGLLQEGVMVLGNVLSFTELVELLDAEEVEEKTLNAWLPMLWAHVTLGINSAAVTHFMTRLMKKNRDDTVLLSTFLQYFLTIYFDLSAFPDLEKVYQTCRLHPDEMIRKMANEQLTTSIKASLDELTEAQLENRQQLHKQLRDNPETKANHRKTHHFVGQLQRHREQLLAAYAPRN